MERVVAGGNITVRLTINGAKKDYRILEVKAHVVLDIDRSAANLPQTGAIWSIPAGVGGAAGWVERPDKSVRYGWDHYDGMMFVVINGIIEDAIPWTSYSARVRKNGKDMSSIRGNRRYTIRSYLSSKHSFTFQIVDEQAHIAGAVAHKVREVGGQKKSPVYELDRELKSTLADKRMYKMVYSERKKKDVKKRIRKLPFYTYASADNLLVKRLVTVLDEDKDEVTLAYHKDPLADNTSWRIVLYDGTHEARYYFQPPLKIDDCPPDEIPPHGKLNLGKGSIRLHTGYIYSSTTGNGSEGCVVSPFYYYLRNLLVQHHLTEYDFFYAGNTNRSNIEKVRSGQKTSAPAQKLVHINKRIKEFKKSEGTLIKKVTERVNQLLRDTTLSEAELESFEEMLLRIEQMESVMIEPEDAGDKPDPTEYLQLVDALHEIMVSSIVSERCIADAQNAVIVEWKQRLEQLQKQKLSEEMERLSWWYNIIIGDLWLIRPDERPTPTP
jgi:hypothetical protein